MINKKQIINYLKKEFDKLDAVNTGEQYCKNEAQTRSFLIEPFLTSLGYDRFTDIIPEYSADFGDRTFNKVDYAILINSKHPVIIIECKKFGKKLNDKDTGQLNNYFVNTASSKIGILTNGIEYKFYTSEKREAILTKVPFFTFNLENFDEADLDMLTKFHRNLIEVQEIINEANEIAFLNQFDEALFKTLLNPSDNLIKAINEHMPIARMTEQLKEKMKGLVNSYSISTAVEKISEEESKKGGNSGIVTTHDELKYYHVIKTLLVQAKKVDSSRINFRDQKNSFAILIDNNIRKAICYLMFNGSKKKIQINNKVFEIKSIEDVIPLKKELTEMALYHFEN